MYSLLGEKFGRPSFKNKVYNATNISQFTPSSCNYIILFVLSNEVTDIYIVNLSHLRYKVQPILQLIRHTILKKT